MLKISCHVADGAGPILRISMGVEHNRLSLAVCVRVYIDRAALPIRPHDVYIFYKQLDPNAESRMEARTTTANAH